MGVKTFQSNAAAIDEMLASLRVRLLAAKSIGVEAVAGITRDETGPHGWVNSVPNGSATITINIDGGAQDYRLTWGGIETIDRA